MNKSLECLFWYDEQGVLQVRIGDYAETQKNCRIHRQKEYTCYGEGYQTDLNWYVYDINYNLRHWLKPEEVPVEMRATLILIQGSYP